jgi:hypothetical protein
MQHITSWLLGAAAACAALSAAGCGAKPVPTKGVVTVDGKPLAKATVMFTSQEPGGKDATGFTDANGDFELTTARMKDGALPGLYKVTVHHSESIDIPPNMKSPAEVQKMHANAAGKASVVPKIYTRQDQTPLQHRVPDDGDAKLQLRSAP